MKSRVLNRPFASLVLTAMLLLQNPEVHSQSLEDHLQQLVQARLGANFEITTVVEIDKAVNDVNHYLPLPEDPYSTLHSCVLFGGGSGSARTGGFVGIYRDGNILWLSDTTLMTLGPIFWTSREINLDGNVELLFEENNFPSSSQVWIFRWNGSTGSLLSAVSPSGLSVIRGASFTLFDAEGDGVLEIADFSRVDGSATWSWNGTQYGAWPTTPHLPATTIWPRNKVDAVVHCTAQNDTGNGRLYRYSITCKPTSIQRVNEFTIWGIRSVRQVIRPERWDGAFNSGRPKVWYTVKAEDERGVIKQDSTRQGFIVSADASPSAIVRYTLLGENELPEFSEDTLASLQRWLSAEEGNNAVSGSTIASTSAPVPFLTTAYLDSLLDYTTRARTLGWIVQDSTSAKYIEFFSTAKSQIQAGAVGGARATLASVLYDVGVDSLSLLTAEAYALIRFNTEYLLSKLIVSPDVKGGLFVPSTLDVLTVKAKPDTSFTVGDSLVSLTATVRWPSQFNITLGTVTSTYGFGKVDAPVTVGSYTYQKFRTTTHTPISWQAGQEYELFSVPVGGMCGMEAFELTNALSGGEWFVDINYLDKTDTAFYQSSAQVDFASQNKSSSGGATAFNSQRHLIKGGGKLHEAFVSGGEVLYRRSSNGGTSWELTARVSAASGSCISSSLATGASNMVYLVWEQTVGASVALYFARSTDNGSTWTAGDTLPNCSSLRPSSSYQAGSVHPTLAELPGSPTQVVVAFADTLGLKYLKSTSSGGSWVSGPTYIAPTIKSSGDNPRIWYLSLAPAASYLMLTYDYRGSDQALYSRTYTASGGWSTEAFVASATGTTFDRFSSVAILDDNSPLAAWCSQKMVGGTLDTDYRIMFRTGTSSNTWSTFTEFAKTSGISDYYSTSSTVSAPYGGGRGYRIIYHRSNGEVYTQAKPYSGGSWSRARLSTSGAWGSATLEKGTNTTPTFLWTDQSQSPYLIPVTASLGTPMAPGFKQGGGPQEGVLSGSGEELIAHRKVVLEDSQNHSFLSYELSPIRLVNSKGDTVSLPFKLTDSLVALTADNVWDYLGTEVVDVAKDSKTLIVNLTVETAASADSSGRGLQMKSNTFSQTSKAYSIALGASQLSQAPLATGGTEGSSQPSATTQTIVTIPPTLRGTKQTFRVVGAQTNSSDLIKRLALGVGDVIY